MTLKFTPDHEWLLLQDNGVAIVGVTVHAQDALGNAVFVDLPEVGKTYLKGEVAGVVESVKAAADVYMPIDGTVTDVNEELRATPGMVNSDPQGAGWFFKITVTNPAQFNELMDEMSYINFSEST